jgi:hypothetical protein
MCTGEANYFRDYKKLGAFAKLATSYMSTSWQGGVNEKLKICFEAS